MLKNKLSKLLLTTAAILCVNNAVFAAETYRLDPMHTAVVWKINHFGFSNPSGKFMNIDGVLTLDEKNPAASKLSVTIPIADVNSGIAKLDENIKGKEFLDAEKFPTATFVSDKIDLGENNTAVVHGILTLHGIAKPLDLQVKLNKLGKNFFQKQTAGFTATATLKRSDFGVNAYLPGLSDQVDLEIESEANLVEETTPGIKK